MINLFFALVLAVASATGCVTKTRLRQEVGSAVALANEDCKKASEQKDARLKAFNQLNPDGSLR